MSYCKPVTQKHLLGLITKAQALDIPEKAKAFIVNHLIVAGQGPQLDNNTCDTPTGWPHNYWHNGKLCTGMGWNAHAFEFGKLMNDVYLTEYTDFHAWSHAREDAYYDANDSAIKIWQQFFCE